MPEPCLLRPPEPLMTPFMVVLPWPSTIRVLELLLIAPSKYCVPEEVVTALVEFKKRFMARWKALDRVTLSPALARARFWKPSKSPGPWKAFLLSSTPPFLALRVQEFTWFGPLSVFVPPTPFKISEMLGT